MLLLELGGKLRWFPLTPQRLWGQFHGSLQSGRVALESLVYHSGGPLGQDLFCRFEDFWPCGPERRSRWGKGGIHKVVPPLSL